MSDTIQLDQEAVRVLSGPESGITHDVVPCLAADLKAVLKLAEGEKPALRIVRGKVVFTAYYGFGDASSGGFGATVGRELMEFMGALDSGEAMQKTRDQTIESCQI